MKAGDTVTLHPVETVWQGFALPGKHPDYPAVNETDLPDSIQVVVEWLSEPFALVTIADGHGKGAIAVVPSAHLHPSTD
jgi:hypothetical protein